MLLTVCVCVCVCVGGGGVSQEKVLVRGLGNQLDFS